MGALIITYSILGVHIIHQNPILILKFLRPYSPTFRFQRSSSSFRSFEDYTDSTQVAELIGR